MSKKLNIVPLDYERICKELEKQKKSKIWLSVEIGKSRSYFSNLPGSKRGKSVPENVEALIARSLGYKPGTFIEVEQKKIPVKVTQPNVFEKLYTNQEKILIKLDEVSKRLAEVEKSSATYTKKEVLEKRRYGEIVEHLEFIRSKSNANTLQVEKIKSMLLDMDNSSIDNQEQLLEEIKKVINNALTDHAALLKDAARSGAYKLLDEMIIDRNGLEQSQIFAAADAKNISRKDLLRAKNEMEIQVISRGVGKNSKKYWCRAY